MGQIAAFDRNVPGAVYDRNSAGAAVLGDAAAHDINVRRTISVAVHRDDSAGPYFQAPHAEGPAGHVVLGPKIKRANRAQADRPKRDRRRLL